MAPMNIRATGAWNALSITACFWLVTLYCASTWFCRCCLQANSIAQQSISQIRTVAAFSGEPIALNSYETALETPYKVGVRHSLLLGLTLGGILGVVYVSYAVALVYGAHRVAAGAYTGGVVLNVIMATIMGGFSLGMVS